MASSSQIKGSSQSSTVPNNEIHQLEDELSSISLLLSELRSQESSHLNSTSVEQDLNATQGDEMGINMQDEEVQALLEKLEQLRGLADGVEDRMDTLLVKLDDMLGVLENEEIKGKLEKESASLDGRPEKESDEAGDAQVGQPTPEPQASPQV
jgi:hypothetical protein